ncbi:hypothetical protein BASA81_004873 [Batrachochytrium salamandrivorans]|nr:hypothetical protein BASA81_004873 [Batrachochytrium salamandrivorans]
MSSSSFSKLLSRLSVRTRNEHSPSASPRNSLPRRFHSTSTGSLTPTSLSVTLASTAVLESILSNSFKRGELVDELVTDQDLDAVTQVKFVAHVLQYERELDFAIKRDLHAAIMETFLCGEAVRLLCVATTGEGQETDDVSKLKQIVVRHLLTSPRVKHTILQELLGDL